MNKLTYTGLLTKRTAVECSPLLETSVKVKTQAFEVDGTTTEWHEDDATNNPLQTSITPDPLF